MYHYSYPKLFMIGLITALLLLLPNMLWAQSTTPTTASFTSATPQISGGAEGLTAQRKDVTFFGPLSQNTAERESFDAIAASIINAFLGFGFDDNGTENGGSFFIPPDPSGAAGTDRLIAVVNTMIEARSKAGALLWRDSLKDFFSPLGAQTLGTRTFDPKVIFDTYENRFVVITLEFTDTALGAAANASRILLAVSKTATPASQTAADWYYFAIDSKVTISGTDYWADYPGFEVDEEAIYITNNLFSFGTRTFGGVRLWIVPKGVTGGFYGGGVGSVAIHNPYASGGIATTTMPAQVYGAGGVGGSIGTFLVSYSGLSSGGIEVVQVVRVDNPLTTPTFTQEFVSVGDIDNTSASLPGAPQQGTAQTISTNDPRALDAVWRNNALWLVATINPSSGPDAGQATAHWFRLNTAAVPGGAITLADQGNIGGEDIASGTFTFFPSVAVNSQGDASFGFAASAPSIYAGAYVAGRQSTDSAGTVQASQVVKAGVDYYYRAFGGTRNRWGDYSGISLDPSNDNRFWVFNEWADTRGTVISGEDGRWGTAWGSYTLSAATGTIKLVKNTVNNNGTFNFSSPDADLDAISITTSGNTGQSSTLTKNAASYQVTEDTQANWALTALACTGDTDNGSTIDLANRRVTIDLDAGENIVCTFTNTFTAPPTTGTIKLVKNTVNNNGTFNFSSPDADLDAISITTSGNTGQSSTLTKNAASYQVTEESQANWVLTALACTGDNDNGSTVDLANRRVTIDLEAGENIVCTFTNTYTPPPTTGTIRLVKNTVNNNGTFSFTSPDAELDVVSITTSGNTGQSSLLTKNAGSYQVTEDSQANWALTTLTCTGDNDNGSTIEVANRRVTIDLDAGENIVCTFTNTYTPPTAMTCMQFAVNLDGRKEVPANPSTARGAGAIRVNTTTNTLSYYITYTGLSSRETSASISGFAAVGSNAGILYTLPLGASKTGAWTYAEAQEANILAGLAYVNIYSQRYPNGEIRGQIANGSSCTTTVLAAEVADLTQEEAIQQTIFLPVAFQ